MKVSSRLSGEKKKIQSSVCWVRGSGNYDRKKKKQSSVWRVVLLHCVSFWFWREIGFGCTYYYVLGVPYSCGVVLVFLSSVWWVRDRYYDRKKQKIQSSVWRVRNHYYDWKKKDTVVCLVGARSLLRPEKKNSSRLSGGCAIIITTGKKGF